MPSFLENVCPGELLTKWADLGALIPTQDIFVLSWSIFAGGACDGVKYVLLSVLKCENEFHINCVVTYLGLEMGHVSPLTKLGLGKRHVQTWTFSWHIINVSRHVWCFMNTRINLAVLHRAAELEMVFSDVGNLKESVCVRFQGPYFPSQGLLVKCLKALNYRNVALGWDEDQLSLLFLRVSRKLYFCRQSSYSLLGRRATETRRHELDFHKTSISSTVKWSKNDDSS